MTIACQLCTPYTYEDELRAIKAESSFQLNFNVDKRERAKGRNTNKGNEFRGKKNMKIL